jgi:hypothetical protein
MFIQPIIYFVHEQQATLLSKAQEFLRMSRIDAWTIGAMPEETGRLPGVSQRSGGNFSCICKKSEVWLKWKVL